MKKGITFLLTILFYTTYAKQDPAIKGKVIDETGAGVVSATVILQKASDSTMVKAEATNEDGEYIFNHVTADSYSIKITYVGYLDYITPVFDFDTKKDAEVPLAQLKVYAENLSEVVVKASRAIVEVHPDKTVFNVDGSVNAVGNTALELLRKSPGVVVDNNENLLLQGKNGVQVYIDGKKSPLTATDLANYLKTMQSSEIDAIEIITNPSARYDAEGNAGIINIRLKKDQNIGLNGTLNLGVSQGKTSRYNGSGTFNYRNQDFNTFGSYSLSRRQNDSEFYLYREQGGNYYDQRNKNVNDGLSHNFRLGTDLFLNKKNTLGFLVNGTISDNDQPSDSRTKIGSLSDGIIDSFLLASNEMTQDRNNLNFNINYAFNSGKGKSLNIDLDYGLYRNDGSSFQPNRYLGPDESTLLFEKTFSNVTPTDIDIYTAKLDYETPLFKGKLAAGAKTSLVRTDNTFDNFDIVEGERIKNLARSNNFIYSEFINALYTSWQRKIGDKIDLMLGLRMEQTNSTGDLASNQANNQVVERDYLDFFPSGGITFQSNKNNSFRINYSRRIDRPNYQDLNPFEFKLDELTFQRGNPFLNPQYSNSYSLSHTHKYKLNSTLSYTVTNDLFTQITDAVDERTAALTHINLARQTNLALTVSYPFSVAKWWNVYTTATAFRVNNEANIDGKVIDLAANAFNFYGQNTFLLPKGFKMELSGWYNAPTLWGNWVTNAQYDVSVGVSKSLLADNATLKLSFSDLLYTNGWGGESRFGNLYMRGGGTWESRQVRLNFSYLFGNRDVKAARKRSTGLEDEQRRIGSGN
jgi:hypothetical protein